MNLGKIKLEFNFSDLRSVFVDGALELFNVQPAIPGHNYQPMNTVAAPASPLRWAGDGRLCK